MTTKRFTVDSFIKDYHSHIIDNNGEIKTLEEYVNYLNNLINENEQLKHQLSQQEMEYVTDCHRLAEENEQLKQRIKENKND